MAKSNIYLKLPSNIVPGSSDSDKFLLENNVATTTNAGLSNTILSKLGDDRRFTLADIGIKSASNVIFLTTRNKANGNPGNIFGGI